MTSKSFKTLQAIPTHLYAVQEIDNSGDITYSLTFKGGSIFFSAKKYFVSMYL